MEHQNKYYNGGYQHQWLLYERNNKENKCYNGYHWLLYRVNIDSFPHFIKIAIFTYSLLPFAIKKITYMK